VPALVRTGSISAVAGPEAVTAWLAKLGLDPGLLDPLQIGDCETRILPLGESVYVAAHTPLAKSS